MSGNRYEKKFKIDWLGYVIIATARFSNDDVFTVRQSRNKNKLCICIFRCALTQFRENLIAIHVDHGNITKY